MNSQVWMKRQPDNEHTPALIQKNKVNSLLNLASYRMSIHFFFKLKHKIKGKVLFYS